jgi:hypothetical protein
MQWCPALLIPCVDSYTMLQPFVILASEDSEYSVQAQLPFHCDRQHQRHAQAGLA